MWVATNSLTVGHPANRVDDSVDERTKISAISVSLSVLLSSRRWSPIIDALLVDLQLSIHLVRLPFLMILALLRE